MNSKFVIFVLFFSLCILSFLISSSISTNTHSNNQGVKLINKNSKNNNPININHESNEKIQRKRPKSLAQQIHMDTIDCDACKTITFLVQQMIFSNTSETDFIDFLIKICIDRKIETPTVCSGIIPEFKNEFLEVLQDKFVTPETVCSFLLFCPPLNHTQPANLTFPKPKPPFVPPTPPQKNNPRKYILQLTDIHWDPSYTVGTNTDCGEPLCCRPDNGPGNAGIWGNYNCDANLLMMQNMFSHISKMQPQPDYIFWTGDNPPHNIWEQTKEYNLNASNTLSEILYQYFPNTPIFPALGNHESVPVNSFPPPPRNQWLLKDLAQQWSRWIPSSAAETVQYAGYYTMEVEPGLRVISINTNYCNNGNLWLLLNDTDPGNQLQWMINVLQASEDIQEKVMIIGHIPMGNVDCIPYYGERYYQIINRYEATIIAQFFGHTHRDSFSVFYDYDETGKIIRPSNVYFVSPSVTSYTDINPSFRIYELDTVTRQFWDYKNYLINLTRANEVNEAVWQMEYSARDAYNLTSLLPTQMDELTQRFEQDAQLTELYFHYHMTSFSSAPCDSKCQKLMICDARSGGFQQMINCMNGTYSWQAFLDELEDRVC